MEMLMKKHTVISVAATIAVAMSLSGCAGTVDELKNVLANIPPVIPTE